MDYKIFIKGSLTVSEQVSAKDLEYALGKGLDLPHDLIDFELRHLSADELEEIIRTRFEFTCVDPLVGDEISCNSEDQHVP